VAIQLSDARKTEEFCINCKLGEGAFCPITQVINEDAKQYRSPYLLLEYPLAISLQVGFVPLATAL